MRALLAALLLCRAAAAAAADPIDEALAKLAREGLKPVSTLRDTVGGTRLAAVIARKDGDPGDRLYAYAVVGKRAALVYLEPNHARGTIAFDESLGRKRLPDFLKDGSRSLLYRISMAGTGESTLVVARYEKPRFRVVGRFRDARIADLDGDGRREIVHRTLPLGRFYDAACGDRGTMAQEAYRVDVVSWRGARFASVSKSFPAFFRERIRKDEEALAALEPTRRDAPGRFLAAAVTLFFDHEALGEKRAGWERLSAAIEPTRALPGAKDCVEEIRRGLRPRLGIPEDWR